MVKQKFYFQNTNQGVAFVLQDTDGCEHTEIFDKEK
jgi:hypothetical protein